MTEISVRDISVELAGKTVLDSVSLTVAPGELVGLIGPNGAGKTTLLRSVLGLLPLARGQITIGGRQPQRIMGSIGYVPQRHEFAWDYPISVEKAVLAALAHRAPWLGGYRSIHRRAAFEALSHVELTELRHRPVAQLSGGQRQRVLVARALALQPMVLLLDEPFSGLDVPTQHILSKLLARQRELGATILLTTHDMPTAKELCTRLCLLNRTVIADAPPGELTDSAVWLQTFGALRAVVS